MNHTTCTATACATPTPDGLHLCDPHEGELFALLGQIPDTLADAADTVARLDGHATTRGAGTATTTSAPVNLEASARVDALQHTIADYCGRLHAAIPAAGVASADYLRRRLPDLIRQPWAGEALDQIATAHRRLVAAVDRPPEIRTFGPCQEDGCPGKIRAAAGHPIARCRVCGAQYEAGELMGNAISNAWQHAAPLAAVVRALRAVGVDVHERTVRTWAERGHLGTPAATRDGRPLYTMAQVLAAATRHRHRGATATGAGRHRHADATA